MIVEDLLVRINKRVILNKLSFEFARGNSYGIIGRNGSGKTTFLKAILNLVKFRGSIYYTSSDSKIGFVPEEPVLYSDLTVIQNLNISGINFNNKADVYNKLELCKLEEVKDKKVKTLSQGQKKRLLIAMAIISNAKILLFDEPLNGLDDEGRYIFGDIISRKTNDSIIVIVSHDFDLIEKYCSKVLFLKSGKFIQTLDLAEIKQNYGDLGIAFKTLC
uniref:ABC transporter ATP-binding protein n=1 Tax=uncultured Draconibacterium sp. TaxID=1573823 RepID=UPI0032171E78